HVALAGFELRKKADQRGCIEAFGKAFALHQATIFQDARRKQETIGADEIDARVGRHPGDQFPQNAADGALADGNAAGQSNQIRNFGVRMPEKPRRRLKEILAGREIQVEQTGKRQVNVHYFVDRDDLVDAAQGGQAGFGKQQGRLGAQAAPLVPREVEISGGGPRSHRESLPYYAGCGPVRFGNRLGRLYRPLETLRMKSTALLLAASALITFTPAWAQHGTPANGEWRVNGGDSGSTRYSPLDQINASNVKNLQVVWRWKAQNMGPSPQGAWEVTPLEVGGKLYFTAGTGRTVVAADAVTGETLWTYRGDDTAERGAVRANNRGLSYWSDGKGDDRILVITPGYQLVALNAKTGLPVAGFGTDAH